jgi:hypothetical protein
MELLIRKLPTAVLLGTTSGLPYGNLWHVFFRAPVSRLNGKVSIPF